MEVTYNGEKYVANYFSQGKTWFSKPCLEILKDGKIIHKDKSYNTFVLESFFCEKGIISLIDNQGLLTWQSKDDINQIIRRLEGM